MRHTLVAILCLLATSYGEPATPIRDPQAHLLEQLDRLDVYRVDGGISGCMDVRALPGNGDTSTFELSRRSAPCPIPSPASFRVVLSTGVVLEASSGQPLERLVQAMRRNARHQVPDWVYRGEPDPDCGFDPDCSVIRAGGGGSFKKR